MSIESPPENREIPPLPGAGPSAKPMAPSASERPRPVAPWWWSAFQLLFFAAVLAGLGYGLWMIYQRIETVTEESRKGLETLASSVTPFRTETGSKLAKIGTDYVELKKAVQAVLEKTDKGLQDKVDETNKLLEAVMKTTDEVQKNQKEIEKAVITTETTAKTLEFQRAALVTQSNKLSEDVARVEKLKVLGCRPEQIVILFVVDSNFGVNKMVNRLREPLYNRFKSTVQSALPGSTLRICTIMNKKVTTVFNFSESKGPPQAAPLSSSNDAIEGFPNDELANAIEWSDKLPRRVIIVAQSKCPPPDANGQFWKNLEVDAVLFPTPELKDLSNLSNWNSLCALRKGIAVSSGLDQRLNQWTPEKREEWLEESLIRLLWQMHP